ncbi:MAG: TRAP transporter TatT component family protein [Verrucomicrobiota bacterium]|jgi:predicted anti-sigma-YlaC factor YlaD
MPARARKAAERASRAVALFALFALIGLLATGCSIRRMAVNKVGDALAGGGTTFASDDDPELVKAAVPFSLKLMESLLAESPRHRGLLSATTSGFTQYAFAFVQQDADEMQDRDLATAEAMRTRARRLYLRARDYGLRGLEVTHPNFTAKLRVDPKAAGVLARVRDVPLLYWTATAWAAAISLAKDDPHLIAEIPQVEALIDRALALEEGYDSGAIHGFLINYEMVRQDAKGDPAEQARRHFERAMALSRGWQAGPLVTFAEAVCVQKQNLKEFDALLNQALAINADAHPEVRLVNLVMQRRARWLLARRADLFLIPDAPGEKPSRQP